MAKMSLILFLLEDAEASVSPASLVEEAADEDEDLKGNGKLIRSSRVLRRFNLNGKTPLEEDDGCLGEGGVSGTGPADSASCR